MIKNKVKFGLLTLLVFSIFVSGAAAVTPAITTEGAIETTDNTPSIAFTPIGNNASYICTLWIGTASGSEIASGYTTVLNNTAGSITCNRTLVKGTYTYNVSMYNATESPATTFSSDAVLKVTTFGSVIAMLTSLVGIFTPILNIVAAIIPIMVAIGITVFVLGLLTSILVRIKGKI